MASPGQTGKARRGPTLGLRWLALLAVALGLALAGAGCGSDDDDAAGTTAEPAATTGPGSPATVPDAAAADLADAAQQFADAGLRVAVQYVPASEPRGRVIGQSRPAGTELQRGDAVSLQVSVGPDPPE